MNIALIIFTQGSKVITQAIKHGVIISRAVSAIVDSQSVIAGSGINNQVAGNTVQFICLTYIKGVATGTGNYRYFAIS